jgi:hypothetical protein
MKKEMVVVENVNVPGYTTKVDAAKYLSMKTVLLKVLPDKKPGLKQAEMIKAVIPRLPHVLFPGGSKAGWWVKTVQLDLEAKGMVIRENSKPMRWHKKV